MSYKTELHCHTSESSKCALETPERVVERYLDAGYSTLVITNHINHSTYACDRFEKYLSENGFEDTWDHRVDYFVRDYNRAVKAANGKLNIILGLELRLIADTPNDYLIYGVTEEWLRNSEMVRHIKIKELSQYVRESGLLIYQAHPFRNGITIVKPSLLDGYEVFNGNLGHDSRNDIAEAWAKKFDLPGISGSDLHKSHHVICAGIETDFPITNNEELLQALKEQNYKLITI